METCPRSSKSEGGSRAYRTPAHLNRMFSRGYPLASLRAYATEPNILWPPRLRSSRFSFRHYPPPPLPLRIGSKKMFDLRPSKRAQAVRGDSHPAGRLFISNFSVGFSAEARTRERRRNSLALYGPPPTSGVNPGQQDSHGLGEMGTRKGDSRGAVRIISLFRKTFS